MQHQNGPTLYMCKKRNSRGKSRAEQETTGGQGRMNGKRRKSVSELRPTTPHQHHPPSNRSYPKEQQSRFLLLSSGTRVRCVVCCVAW